MVDSPAAQNDGGSRCKKGRLARIGLFAVFIIGLGAIGATLIGPSWAHGSWKHHGSRIDSIQDARERASDIAAWVTGTVDGSAQQGQEIDVILVALAETLYPLAQTHHGQHRVLLSEATRPEVNRESLEQIRPNALTLADQASTALVDAFVDVAEVLEPEQRQELIAVASRFKRHHD